MSYNVAQWSHFLLEIVRNGMPLSLVSQLRWSGVEHHVAPFYTDAYKNFVTHNQIVTKSLSL